MIWFLRDFNRLERERVEIADLLVKAPWLKGATWRLDGSDLILDADIAAHGYIYPVRMRYPATYPANPPAVWPRGEEGEWWSTHQYGPGGELCLEWGPDTWVPDVTGAQVLVSAYRLLDTENPKSVARGESAFVIAPSRHAATLGQEMRRTVWRFLATAGLRSKLDTLSNGAYGELEVLGLVEQHKTITALVLGLRPEGTGSWTDSTLPQRLKACSLAWRGLFVRVDVPAANLRVKTIEELIGVFASYPLFAALLREQLEAGTVAALLAQDNAGGLHLFRLQAKSNELISFSVVDLPPERLWERVGAEVDTLAGKSVGIVGLGSAGSKIALTLARSGVKRFVLVDDDLFLPENLVRHTLDWRSVGEHKVDAIEDQLALISSSCAVDVWRLRLTGQESTASVAGSLSALARCDLIIDATADSATFNQLSMVAEQYRRTFIWLEVYAGGIGGMVARHRPEKDADPHEMRDCYHAFTAGTEAPPPPKVSLLGPYSAAPATEGGQPIVASDADVAIISHHAARLALDALTEREPSAFKYSMYLIGLNRGWVFDQPFQTFPVDTGPPSTHTTPAAAVEVITESARFLNELLESQVDGGHIDAD